MCIFRGLTCISVRSELLRFIKNRSLKESHPTVRRTTAEVPLPDEGDDEEADLYRRAIQVVAESQKASTSYIQRQLRIGYNNAARLIERMEKDGYVGGENMRIAQRAVPAAVFGETLAKQMDEAKAKAAAEKEAPRGALDRFKNRG